MVLRAPGQAGTNDGSSSRTRRWITGLHTYGLIIGSTEENLFFPRQINRIDITIEKVP